MGPFIDASITNQEHEENFNVTLKHLQHSSLNNVILIPIPLGIKLEI